MLLIKEHPLDTGTKRAPCHMKKRVRAKVNRDAQILMKAMRKVDRRRTIALATRGDLQNGATRMEEAALKARIKAMKATASKLRATKSATF